MIANLLDRDFLRRDGEAVAIDAFLILLGGMAVGVLARWGSTAAVVGAVLLVAGLAGSTTSLSCVSACGSTFFSRHRRSP